MKIEEILAQLNDLQDYCEERTKAEYNDRGTWGDDSEALEEAVKLLWKEVPRKVDVTEPLEDEDSLTVYRCPECGNLLGNDRYCSYCGQRLDWRDLE